MNEYFPYDGSLGRFERREEAVRSAARHSLKLAKLCFAVSGLLTLLSLGLDHVRGVAQEEAMREVSDHYEWCHDSEEGES